MKKIGELNLGFSDAQNYARRDNKKMFNDIFVKNYFLEKIINPNTYFLIGEKGTGKTAYSVYLKNNNYKENKTILTYISATDYDKFYNIKKQKNLELTDFVGIWKVILLLLLSKSITDDDKVLSLFNKSNIDDLLRAIDEYYMNAFTPEIITALKIVDETELAAKLICKYSEVSGKSDTKLEFSETRFQMNLFYIEKQFSDAIKRLKLNRNVNLFIDGIDIRPNVIPYDDYIQCIRGLADACWALNTELFQNVKDSKGHLKIVLLLRPDIFSALNLQNATNKLRDNAVFLDWRTTYKEYKTSNLYKVSRRILEYQQENVEEDLWEKYFSWTFPTTSSSREYDTAFMDFLRISLSRPRDIIVILQLLQEFMLRAGQSEGMEFSKDIYQSDDFQNAYSEYFMSSIKDQLSFYYSVEDFNHFKKFFDYFKDSDFSYEEYVEVYDKFTEYILTNAKEIPEFVDDPIKFLQLLYDSNVIAAIENYGEPNAYYHFSYREKSLSNIEPKVPIDENVSYRFHYGLYKKAKFGRF